MNIKSLFLVFVSTALMLATACTGGQTGGEFLESECSRWLGDSVRVRIDCRPAFKAEGRFGYSFNRRHVLTLRAADRIGALDALYTFCEALGITFDVTGATVPESLDWAGVEGTDSTITPRVRWRGVRQHVNFPMDISSYPIEEACAYLDDMVRMRFNKITIHSYPGQWYAEDIRGEMHPAGNFFYGCTQRIDNSEFLKSICADNDSVFCIPAAEAVFNDMTARSDVAVEWMRQLIGHAKWLGMRVQFSFEPREFTVDETVRLADIIMGNYPQIDDLELITQETAGTGEESGQELIGQIDTIAAAIRKIESGSGLANMPENLKAGIYCVAPNHIGPSYSHAREVLPEHMIAVLPRHGSKGVAEAFPLFIRDAEDLRWTEMYSWIEFDGQMFLQQNATGGIDALLTLMDEAEPGMQHESVLFNHWRTAENRTACRFASEALIDASIHEDGFYDSYAGKLGIEDKDTYRKAMHLMEDVSEYAKSHTMNIGFAWSGGWRTGGQFMNMKYKPEYVEHESEGYKECGELLSALYLEAEADAARKYLELLGNRTLSTILYLDAFRKGMDIRDNMASEKMAAKICNASLAGLQDCIETYARLLPDRGSLGTVVCIWNSTMQGMRYLRSQYGGIPIDSITEDKKPSDEPPLPVFY